MHCFAESCKRKNTRPIIGRQVTHRIYELHAHRSPDSDNRKQKVYENGRFIKMNEIATIESILSQSCIKNNSGILM